MGALRATASSKQQQRGHALCTTTTVAKGGDQNVPSVLQGEQTGFCLL